MTPARYPTVFVVSHEYGHHARRSGYARLAEYLGLMVSVHSLEDTAAAKLMTKTPLWVREDLVRWAYMPTYGLRSLPFEAAVIQYWFERRACLFHYLYGEETYRYSGNLKRFANFHRRNVLVATYHLPPSQLKRILVARNHIKRLDRIIVVGSSQKPFFQELVAPEKVVCIPHGVDIEYFKPGAERMATEATVTCLCVGHLMRDFETLLAAAWILKLENAPVKIIIVDAHFDMPHFAGLDNVEVRRGVPDEELRLLYQTADICLLPLRDCTANNALLEAMACGLPIVATDVGSVLDYVDSSCALLTPHADARALVDAVMRLVDEPWLRKTMGDAARQRVERFAWPVVAAQVAKLYQDMVNGPI